MAEKQPQSRSLTFRVGCTCLAVFPIFFLLVYGYFQHKLSSITSFVIALRAPTHQRRPTIWLSNQTCIGSFSSPPSEFSDKAFPNALLRDAFLDVRPPSQRQARRKHGSLPTQRVLMALTLHLSVQVQSENVTAWLRNAPDVQVQVDDVQEIVAHVVGKEFEYSPGKTTKRGMEVHECQLLITLRSKVQRSDFVDYLQTLATDPRVVMELDIPLDRFDGKKLWFKPNLTFGCIFGWQAPSIIRSHAPARIDDPSAILFCANSLSGKKKKMGKHHFEIAHWAARSLQGMVRFDIVVLPIIVDRSVAECDMANRTCLEDVSTQNENMFNSVADNVVTELDKIGVADDVYERIVLMPFCRLGTHALGYERGDACRGSQRYAQHHVTFMPYTLLGRYYKWAMMYDLDEYVGMSSGDGPGGMHAAKAGSLFDDILRKTQHLKKAAFTIAWLNFYIEPQDVRKITSEVMRGKSQKLVSTNDSSTNCYELGRKKTGKAVVRYDVGLGFVVHQPIVQMPGRGMTHNMWQVSCRSERLRVWHARLRGNPLSRCAYAAPGDP